MSIDAFNKLKEELLSCQKCKDIFENDPRPVFQGNRDSVIMQISQAPSQKVMETGKPFNDASGRKLLKDWYQITREEFDNPQYFYITSVGRCYPGKAKTTGDIPPPTHCADYFLKKELNIIEPQIYIISGSYAAKYLFPNETLESLIFNDHIFQGRPLYVLPHPSPLNRKWLKDHPQFEQDRMPQIRTIIHKYIEKE